MPSPLIRIPLLGFTAHNKPRMISPQDLELIIPIKTLFPKKSNIPSRHKFGGSTMQPTTQDVKGPGDSPPSPTFECLALHSRPILLHKQLHNFSLVDCKIHFIQLGVLQLFQLVLKEQLLAGLSTCEMGPAMAPSRVLVRSN